MLAYVNDQREFFMYLQPIDKALPMDDVIGLMATNYPNGRAHTISDDLATHWLSEPSSQTWHPIPLSDISTMSLEQFIGHRDLSRKEDAAAKAAAEEAKKKSASAN